MLLNFSTGFVSEGHHNSILHVGRVHHIQVAFDSFIIHNLVELELVLNFLLSQLYQVSKKSQ